MKTNLPVLVDGLQQYMAEVNRFALLSREEEYELALRHYETGDVDAAQRLVLSNLRFVVKIAYEYRAYGFRMSDLIQEGNVGLLMAVKKFNPYKGFRLISYAVWWIKSQIHDFILRSWSLVKIGTTRVQRRLFNRLQSAQHRIKGNLAAADSDVDQKLASDLDISADEVTEFRQRVKQKDVSIDVPIHEDGNTFVRDRLVDQSVSQEETLADEETQQILKQRIAEAENVK